VLLLLASTEGILIGDFEIARTVVELIEVLAVAVIAMGVVFALVAATQQWFRSSSDQAFHEFKRHMARGLLVGLDLLIAADVIKTVTLEATLENAMVLAILVLIRTFLSWTLVLEVEGQWPWQTSLTNDPPSTDE
jgi:uncharacterized membrane protein